MNIILDIKIATKFRLEVYIVLANGVAVSSHMSMEAARNWCNRAVNTGKAIMA
jgi:hypothetical protein